MDFFVIISGMREVLKGFIRAALILLFAGLCYGQGGQADLQSTLESLKNQPGEDQVNASVRLGFSLNGNGRFSDAEKIFDALLDIYPNKEIFLYGKALALFNLKKHDKASEYINIAKSKFAAGFRNPLQADVLVLSALIRTAQADSEGALKELVLSKSIYPNHFDTRFSLGRAYFGNGEIQAAIQEFREAARINPKHLQARFFLATALERNSLNAEAGAIYQDLTKLYPDYAEAYMGLGVLQMKIEGINSSEALANLLKSIELNGNLYEARIAIGKIYLARKRLGDSILHLKKATQLSSGNPEPHYQLALAYRRAGMKKEAEAEMAEVKKIHEGRRLIAADPK